MTKIPQEWIDAAIKAFMRPAVSAVHAMQAALEAAAPLIEARAAAAERAHIIALARSESSRHEAYGSGVMAAALHGFADLLTLEAGRED